MSTLANKVKLTIPISPKKFAASPIKKPNTAASPTKSVTTIVHNLNNRRISMTVSLVACKFDSAQHKDFVIQHEKTVDRCLTARAGTSEVKSPKRDPILQNNEEPIQEFRSTIRRDPNADRMSMFNEDIKYSKKIQGEYHDLLRARSVSPRAEGLRMCNPYKEFQPDVVKRQLKGVELPFTKKVFNPITEGDVEGVQVIKQRVVHPEASPELQKMNNRKTVLAADLGASKKGKIFRDTNKILGEQDVEAWRDRSPARKTRKYKDRSGAKALIEYSYSPDFRDQGVSGKCTAVPAKQLLIKPCFEEETY